MGSSTPKGGARSSRKGATRGATVTAAPSLALRKRWRAAIARIHLVSRDLLAPPLGRGRPCSWSAGCPYGRFFFLTHFFLPLTFFSLNPFLHGEKSSALRRAKLAPEPPATSTRPSASGAAAGP